MNLQFEIDLAHKEHTEVKKEHYFQARGNS